LDGELAGFRIVKITVFTRYKYLLAQRSACAAFHPYGGQEIHRHGHGSFRRAAQFPRMIDEFYVCKTSPHKRQSVSEYTLEPYETLWQEIQR